MHVWAPLPTHVHAPHKHLLCGQPQHPSRHALLPTYIWTHTTPIPHHIHTQRCTPPPSPAHGPSDVHPIPHVPVPTPRCARSHTPRHAPPLPLDVHPPLHRPIRGRRKYTRCDPCALLQRCKGKHHSQQKTGPTDPVLTVDERPSCPGGHSQHVWVGHIRQIPDEVA